MNGRSFVLSLCALCALVAQSAEIVNKFGATGRWADAELWEGGVAPTAGDSVVITGRVDLTDADAEIAALVSKITIRAGSSLVVDNAETLVVTGCVKGVGSLVKNGAGMLDLTTICGNLNSGGTSSSYQLNGDCVVSNGVVRFSFTPYYKGNSCVVYDVGRVKVWAPGVFDVPANSYVLMYDVAGDGTILNSGAAKPGTDGAASLMTQLRFSGTCVFDGPINGDNVRVYVPGKCTFNCATSTISYSDFATWGGALAFSSFGMKGAPSTSGYAALILVREYGGTVSYLGEGETTDKDFEFRATLSPYSTTFDAGPNGGVTFTGDISSYGGQTLWESLTLKGDNASPMVIAGKVSENSAGTAYWIKDGTGTWRFAETGSSRKQKGVYDVRNGTLAFESIANSGVTCSLGPQTMLVPESNDHKDVATRVDYSFLLGATPGAVGTLAYVGSAKASTDRRIAVRHKGKLSADCGGALTWNGGAYALDIDSTLVLGGASASAARIDNLNDGETNPLSVEKDGAGTWAFGTNCMLSGKLTVKEGKLNAMYPKAHYTWFKWRIRETNSGKKKRTGTSVEDTNAGARQIAFFDAAGNNLALGAFTENFVRDPSKLKPGEMTYDKALVTYSSGNSDTGTGDKGRNLNRLIDGQNAEWLVNPGKHVRDDIESTWFSVVFRFPDDVAQIVGFDFYSYGSDQNRTILKWDMFGSEDGDEWTLLEERTEESTPSAWYAAGSESINCTTRTLGDANYFAFADGEDPDAKWGAANLAATTVLPGATFAVGREGVEMALPGNLAVTNGGVYGAYQGFTIPAAGFIDFCEEPKWFRVTVRETAAGRNQRNETPGESDDPNVHMQEFALYDAEGVRRNVGLAVDSRCNPSALAPGFCTYDRSGYNYYTNRDADKLFDDGVIGSGWCICYQKTGYVRRDNPESWVVLTMRLGEVGGGIRSCDWATVSGGAGRNVLDFVVEASVDGVTWTQVYEKVAETNDLPSNKWWSDGAAIASGQRRIGFPLDANAIAGIAASAFDTVGAKIDFSGCTGTENLRNWTVRVNGVVKPRVRMKWENGELVRIIPGTAFIIR